jgi:methionyl-tRNA formyltransferase
MNATIEHSVTSAPRAAEARGRLRIVFLGNAYNPVSVQCARALAQAGHEVVLAAYEPVSRGLFKLTKDSWRKYGARFVIRKAATLLRCRARLGLRSLGFRFHSSESLPELAAAAGLSTLRMSNPNHASFLAAVRQVQADLIVVAAFSRILKKEIIETPALGCLNVHASFLPKYRGPNPLYWVLANKEAKTGVTVHFVDEGVDTGPIVLQRELDILPAEDERSLLRRCAQLAAELLPLAVASVAQGAVAATPQDETQASYYPQPPRGASLL